ncbi:MAG: hypothetical protein PVH18_08310, partial [Chloroflexota bacterium]
VFARRVADSEQYAYYTMLGSGTAWSQPLNVSHEPLTVNSNVPFVLIPVLVPCDDTLYVYYHGAPAINAKEVVHGSGSYDNWQHVDQVDVGSARAIRPSATCVGGKIHLVYEKVLQPNIYHQIYYISGSRFAAYLPMVYR